MWTGEDGGVEVDVLCVEVGVRSLGDGLDAAAGERDEPVVDVGGGRVVDLEGEAGDPGAGVLEEDAVDDAGARVLGEGQGEPGHGLPAAAPVAGERGGAHGVANVEAPEDLVQQVRRKGGQRVGGLRRHPQRRGLHRF